MLNPFEQQPNTNTGGGNFASQGAGFGSNTGGGFGNTSMGFNGDNISTGPGPGPQGNLNFQNNNTQLNQSMNQNFNQNQNNFSNTMSGQMGGPMATNMTNVTQSSGVADNEDLELLNEPPILEELQINVHEIVARIKAVVFFKPLDQNLVLNGDLIGPFLIIVSLMFALLLQGKVQFEEVYMLAMVSIFSSYLLINLMSQRGGIDLYCAASMFGYGLLPVVIVAFVAALISLKTHGIFGFIVAAFAVLWCTMTSSRFVSAALDANGHSEQQYLIAYQCGLMYTIFIVIAIF